MSNPTAQDFHEFDQLSKDLSEEVETHVVQNTMLDLQSRFRSEQEDLRRFKSARIDMINKRNALNKAISIVERRIEVSLSVIQTLQKPL